MEIKIADNIEEAKPILLKLKELLELQKIKSEEFYHNTQYKGTKQIELQRELTKIKLDIRILKESIEFVRDRVFIEVSKSYLTRESYNEIWELVDKEIARNKDKNIEWPKCCYCEKELSDDYTREHIIPKSHGGNITTHCCRKCNEEKANLTMNKYISFLERSLTKVRQGTNLHQTIFTKVKNAKLINEQINQL